MQKRIPLDLIYGNPDQPRRLFDMTALRELANSIHENGLKQPITVRPDADGRFMIVMGERRWRAHQLLAADSLATDILCQVSKVDDRQLAIDAIIENDQRVDITPLEQANAYQRMIDVHGFTVEDLARKVGKAEFRVRERLALLRLTDDNRELLRAGVITDLQAFYLSELPAAKQPMMVKAIATGQCNTYATLKAMAATIAEAGSQVALFELPAPPTEVEVREARTFDSRIEAVAALLRSSIVDNEVRAVGRVSRDKLGSTADLIKAMQTDLKRVEVALRVAAAGAAVAAEAA